MGGAVKLGNRDDVPAKLGEVEYRIMQGGLPGAYAERFHSPFERGDAPLEDGSGRIADTAIPVSLDLEIEESGSVLGSVKCVCDRLIDRDGYGLRRRFDVIAAVDGNRFIPHLMPPPIAVIAVSRRGIGPVN